MSDTEAITHAEARVGLATGEASSEADGAPPGPALDPAQLQVEPPPAAKLTPMMRQYLSVKDAHPGCIVLFRMGDFFETFFQDAVDCARILDITLTARSKEGIPMAGVPHHAVDGYVARLIESGRTVVLVDQVEDPKLAKGLVRREVTDVLSPGTFLDPNAPPRTPTYLVALAFGASEKRKRAANQSAWGVAALDLSTGELRATSGEEEDLLSDELGRLGARELLVSEERRGDERVVRLQAELTKTAFTWVKGDHYARARARSVLERRFGADEVKSLEPMLTEEALTAAAVTLAYVEETQQQAVKDGEKKREPLRHVSELRPYLPGDALVLDLQARAHLELFRSAGEGGKKGSLVGAIDEAITAMGGRLLGRWLGYPLRELEPIRERQDAVAAFVAAPSALDRVCDELRGVADLERLVGRVVMGRANPRDLAVLRDTIAHAPVIFGEAKKAAAAAGSAPEVEPELAEVALAHGTGVRADTAPADHASAAPEGWGLEHAHARPGASALLLRLAAADACADVAAELRDALVDEPPVDLDDGDVFRLGWNPELDRLSELSKNGKAMIAAMEAEEREKTGISSLKVRYNRVFGYYIEITRSNLKNVPARYIRKQTTANGERYYTEELRTLESEVLSAEERRSTHARRLFQELVEKVASHARRLGRVAEALATVDVLAGFARIAEKRGWTRPTVDDSGAIEIADGRHPVLELLSTDLGERFVPNDLVITPESSLMIITGPNMAGKSTIMRQTALIVILAHMGAFVPARTARIGLVDRIFTRVGASDDLSRGRSTFMVEMTETARILRSATKHSLILLDEIGRGTSTFDGLSIAWAVAEHLHDIVGAKTLFATHYHELTEITRDKPRAVNHHVEVKEWNDQIVFLRKLLPGPTNRSYGVQVARLAGLPRPVIDRAKTVLAALEAQALAAGDGSPVSTFTAAAAEGGAAEAEAGPALPVAPRTGQLFLFGGGPEKPALVEVKGGRGVKGGALASAPEAPENEAAAAAVIAALAAIDLDDVSPRQALERLFELKALLGNEKKTKKKR